MRSSLAFLTFLSLLLLFLKTTLARPNSGGLQDNILAGQEVQEDFVIEGNLENTNKNDSHHGVIKTAKPKFTIEQGWTYAKGYVDWNNVKNTIHTQRDAILYCSCIITLTTILLIFFKAFKTKFYTNKFNEKDVFTARKLFKSTGSDSAKLKPKPKETLNIIKEEENESCDVENGRGRDSCFTTSEQRNSDMRDTYERGSYANEFNIDGERMQGVLRRNYQDRKTNDEPEILSMFSADKSEDYMIQPRKYIKPNFEDKREQRIEYYKQRERAIFGYDENDEPEFRFAKPKKAKVKKNETGVKNLQLKFNFSDSESDAEDDALNNPREIEINNDFGRQTIDLNGPLYDPSMLPRQTTAWMSEIGYAESEADDMNRLLDQMENQSFKGFGGSDLDNSMEEKLNEGALFRPNRKQRVNMNDIFI